MNWLLASGGVALIALAMLDALWTTLKPGGGPLTDRLSQGIWQAALLVHRTRSPRSHHLLLATGMTILLMIIAVWIVLLWAGWTLLFSAETEAVVSSQTRSPAGLASRIYFTGYTLFTLGMGNYVPQGDLWELLTAAASLNGLFLVTLAITYLVPVVSAATQKRQLAAIVSDLGETPVEIVYKAWDGEGFSSLSTYLAQLTPMIELHAQRHLAYPVLHYFHSPHRRTAISPSLAALDEALLLLAAGVQPRVRLPALAVEPAQKALAGLLATLQQQYIRASEETPRAPLLHELAEAGIPVVGEQAFREAVAEQADRRRLLRAFVRNDGWEWEEMLEKSPSPV